MLGGKNRQPLGYTILEVMIVLAISGVMFLIAATFVSGKQERTAFTAGVNQMTSQIQDVIEQVIDGQYSDIPLNCTFAASGSTGTTSFGSATTAQGTNSNCVFLGKVLQFTSDPSVPGTYNVLSLAGGRLDSSDNLITTLTNADPQAITSPVDLTVNQTVPQGLSLSKIIKVTDATTGSSKSTYSLAFIQSQGALPSVGSTGNPFVGGAQTVGLYYDKSDASLTPPSFSASNLTPATNIDICLTDGTRYADITLGTDSTNTASNPLSVSAHFDGTTKPSATC